VADRERDRLLAFGSHQEFGRRFQVSEAMLNELKRYAAGQGIRERPADLERSHRQITTRLKAGIARNLWGNPGYYEIMLGTDPIFERAQQELRNGV
jgi:carboxyl-terminal processing protease